MNSLNRKKVSILAVHAGVAPGEGGTRAAARGRAAQGRRHGEGRAASSAQFYRGGKSPSSHSARRSPRWASTRTSRRTRAPGIVCRQCQAPYREGPSIEECWFAPRGLPCRYDRDPLGGNFLLPDIRISQPSLQSLFLEMSVDGHALSVATGFVCMSGKGRVLITNRHIVTGRNQITGQSLSCTGGLPDALQIHHNKKGALGQWVLKSESLKDRPWIEHPRLRSQADFVGLPLTDLSEVELYPYEMDAWPDIDVRPSETISVVAFPFGLRVGESFAVWATDFFASEPDIDFQGLPKFLIDCRTRKGQSGSAVIFHNNGVNLIRRKNGDTKMEHQPVTKLLGVYSGRVTSSPISVLCGRRARLPSSLRLSDFQGRGPAQAPMTHSPPDPDNGLI